METAYSLESVIASVFQGHRHDLEQNSVSLSEKKKFMSSSVNKQVKQNKDSRNPSTKLTLA